MTNTESPSAPPALLPCPFCGSAEVRAGSAYNWCAICGCNAPPTIWNSCAPSPTSAPQGATALVERLRNAIRLRDMAAIDEAIEAVRELASLHEILDDGSDQTLWTLVQQLKEETENWQARANSERDLRIAAEAKVTEQAAEIGRLKLFEEASRKARAKTSVEMGNMAHELFTTKAERDAALERGVRAGLEAASQAQCYGCAYGWERVDEEHEGYAPMLMHRDPQTHKLGHACTAEKIRALDPAAILATLKGEDANG